jgi:hypothetical protein
MKSELALQFSPQPIDQAIAFHGSGICGGDRFGFFRLTIQATFVADSFSDWDSALISNILH